MRLIATLAAFLALGATAAEASTVFDLTGNGKWDSSYSFNEDNIGLTVSAGENYGNSVYSGYDYLYQQNHHGLGVYSLFNGSDKELDGSYASEVMTFLFDTAVQLVSITFSKVDSSDDFDFYFDSGSGLSKISSDVDIPNSGQYVFSSLWSGTSFAFGADASDDSFTIKKIEVAQVSAVPLPIALPLYGSGLAVLGFLGWRRRKAIGNSDTFA
ncbi:MAG: hypothetical protein EP348_02370 [Alphaproteobacteria bacterium]|nr:MAG: hypothetical protein EP348_02370 [Alphaproteobacteria bacterium]